MNSADQRRYAIAAATLLGLAVAGWSIGQWLGSRDTPAPPPHAESLPAPRAAAAPQAPVLADSGRCPGTPQVAVSGPDDGRFRLEAAMAQRDRPSAAAFVAVANEAMREGRPRDAEVALMAACRVAGGPVEIDRILARLEGLHAGAEPVTAVMGAAAPSAAPPAADISVVLRCGQGASTAERIVCGDAELAQMDSDIQRLRAQAGSMTRDPAGFRRRSEQAVAQRDARCRDRECLVRWYQQRRAQLLAEF
jgi:hypothetical protein